MSINAYPLQWPVGWRRTPPAERRSSRFKATVAGARDAVLHELQLMGCDAEGEIIISTNIPLRADGNPRGDWERRAITDRGVAVYFFRKGRRVVLACDAYYSIEENMRAIALTLDAMRGIERWGAHEMLDRAFTGFTALPAPERKLNWRQVLGPVAQSVADVKLRYRELALQHHPDRGGNPALMAEINRAYSEAIAELGGAA